MTTPRTQTTWYPTGVEPGTDRYAQLIEEHDRQSEEESRPTRIRVTVELDVDVEALCFAVSEDDFDHLGAEGAAALLVEHVLSGRANMVRTPVFSNVSGTWSLAAPEEV